MRGIKAVIFDLDNTLVNFLDFKEKAVKAAAEAMHDAGFDRAPEAIAEKMFEIYWKTHLENPRIFQDFFGKESEPDRNKYIAAGIIGYRTKELTELEPYDGVLDTLEALRDKGIIIGILSDAKAVKAWFRLIHLGLENEFDFVLTLTETGVEKPSKIAFQRALEEINGVAEERGLGEIEAGDVLMIGDNYKRDFVGAEKAGMQAMVAEYGVQKEFKKDIPHDFPEKKKLGDIKDLVAIIE